jgi:hypothetical protein
MMRQIIFYNKQYEKIMKKFLVFRLQFQCRQCCSRHVAREWVTSSVMWNCCTEVVCIDVPLQCNNQPRDGAALSQSFNSKQIRFKGKRSKPEPRSSAAYTVSCSNFKIVNTCVIKCFRLAQLESDCNMNYQWCLCSINVIWCQQVSMFVLLY